MSEQGNAVDDGQDQMESPVDSDEVEEHGGPVSAEFFEFWATVLIALAAVLTAWAGFESSKWSGVQATNFSQAGAARTESVRFSTVAGQQSNVDINLFINWLNVTVAEIDSGAIEAPASASEYVPTPGTLSGFYFERFRDEFDPAIRAWLNTNPFDNPDAPSSPFDMEEYQLDAADEAAALEQRAQDRADDAATANQNSDNYVLTAVLFATALFFAALASRLGAIRYRYASLIIASLMFTGTFIYILSQPIEI